MEHSTLDLARLTAEATPAALAEWHRSHETGDEIAVHGSWHAPLPFEAVAEGAGTNVIATTSGLNRAQWTLRREMTLADLVAPRLRVLIVGLNPSVVAAETKVPFGGRTNRFWPSAITAGLVVADRDPWRAFADHRIGFTDLVKRASARADDLTTAEYTDGAERLRALVGWLAPRVVCFAGLTGYRAAVDRKAGVGLAPEPFAGALTYVMPNPSGVNTHSSLEALVQHFATVRDLAVE